tara:strand:+ start:238 stop:615 length:378 start_codon:yes stop_codon:yes gene_type:complete
MIKKTKRLKKKNIINDKGTLILSKNILKKFNLKRFFFIKSDKKLIRGEHGHKNCNQIFLSLSNSIAVEVKNKIGKKNFILRKYDSIFVPKKNWVRIKFKKYNSELLVLCDKDFDKNDYFYSLDKI